MVSDVCHADGQNGVSSRELSRPGKGSSAERSGEASRVEKMAQGTCEKYKEERATTFLADISVE